MMRLLHTSNPCDVKLVKYKDIVLCELVKHYDPYAEDDPWSYGVLTRTAWELAFAMEAVMDGFEQ